MQAVILAAGRGIRMGDLTKKTPKPLLEVAGKTLLEHKFDILPDEVDEIILVVGYLADKIRNRFGMEYRGKSIIYVDQENPTGGTADALWHARPYLQRKFLVMYGDDLYAADDMRRCLEFSDWVLVAQKRDLLQSTAKIVTDENGTVTNIIEADSHGGGPGLANTGLYLLDMRIFNYSPVKLRGREETGLPQTMLQAIHDIPLHVFETKYFIAITTPEDLKNAERELSKRV